MSDPEHGYILLRGGGRQRAPRQLLLPVWHTGPHNENASSEREAELGGEAGASPAPVSQGPATSLCLSSPPASAAPQKQAEQGDLRPCHSETQTWGNPWHFLPQTGGSLMLSSFVHLFSTYVGINVHTNCTAPSAGSRTTELKLDLFFRLITFSVFWN